MNILVTGGAGFIGSNFIRYALERLSNANIVNVDKLTYAGNLENLAGVEENYSGRYTFYRGDICDRELISQLLCEHRINAIINYAAETHVDRSIIDSDAFVQTNIVGTKALLDAALDAQVSIYIQISTDEVYGSLGLEGKFTEESSLAPNSPYSASKTAADHLVRAYYKTYELPAIITRCSNNYGPYQFPEKLIPLLITNAVENKQLPIYGDGKNVRDWIHVNDHSAAILTILKNGTPGEVYNIGGDCEKENIEIVELILDLLSCPRELITFVADRPGHDKRYAMDFSKLKTELGWRPEIEFENGLRETVEWYQNNNDWVQNVRTQEYLKYYELNYGNR